MSILDDPETEAQVLARIQRAALEPEPEEPPLELRVECLEDLLAEQDRELDLLRAHLARQAQQIRWLQRVMERIGGQPLAPVPPPGAVIH